MELSKCCHRKKKTVEFRNSSRQKNMSRERENADQLYCLSVASFSRRRGSDPKWWYLLNIVDFFLFPRLGKDAYFSVTWQLTILVSAPWWVREDSFIFVVKICWTKGCLPALKNIFADPKYLHNRVAFLRSIFNVVLILITIVVWIVHWQRTL